jgi:hypothetical protein
MTLEQFKETRHGKALFAVYTPKETGIWGIYGETDDPGGSCFTPLLGVFIGTMADAMEVAVAQKRFVSWGGGGDLRKLTVLTK